MTLEKGVVTLAFDLEGNAYSTFQVGCLREIGSNGEIGIRSIDTKITQTTNPI